MEYGGARFLPGTRGQLVALLRATDRTVDELARELGITQNAVRGHLTSLERDGLVRRSGARRTAGKPAGTYQLSAEAERLFPTACEPALTAVIETLTERLSSREVGAMLRRSGRHLAANGDPPPEDPETRLEWAMGVFRSMGGLPVVEREDGRVVVRSSCCPLGTAVAKVPQLCLVMEAMLADLVGGKVQERCERQQPPTEQTAPRCSFWVTLNLTN